MQLFRSTSLDLLNVLSLLVAPAGNGFFIQDHMALNAVPSKYIAYRYLCQVPVTRCVACRTAVLKTCEAYESRPDRSYRSAICSWHL